MSSCWTRQTRLNSDYDSDRCATQHRKAAKTAMLTAPVNIATWERPGKGVIPACPGRRSAPRPPQDQDYPRHLCRGANTQHHFNAKRVIPDYFPNTITPPLPVSLPQANTRATGAVNPGTTS